MYRWGKELFGILSKNIHAFEAEGEEGYKVGSDHWGKGVRDILNRLKPDESSYDTVGDTKVVNWERERERYVPVAVPAPVAMAVAVAGVTLGIRSHSSSIFQHRFTLPRVSFWPPFRRTVDLDASLLYRLGKSISAKAPGVFSASEVGFISVLNCHKD